jgi:hypothetical protein
MFWAEQWQRWRRGGQAEGHSAGELRPQFTLSRTVAAYGRCAPWVRLGRKRAAADANMVKSFVCVWIRRVVWCYCRERVCRTRHDLYTKVHYGARVPPGLADRSRSGMHYLSSQIGDVTYQDLISHVPNDIYSPRACFHCDTLTHKSLRSGPRHHVHRRAVAAATQAS